MFQRDRALGRGNHVDVFLLRPPGLDGQERRRELGGDHSPNPIRKLISVWHRG